MEDVPELVPEDFELVLIDIIHSLLHLLDQSLINLRLLGMPRLLRRPRRIFLLKSGPIGRQVTLDIALGIGVEVVRGNLVSFSLHEPALLVVAGGQDVPDFLLTQDQEVHLLEVVVVLVLVHYSQVDRFSAVWSV